MISRVKIFGLQRSGTKYIEELIRQNLDVDVEDHGSCRLGWKHAMPNEVWNTLGITKSPAELIAEVPDLFVLVVRKEQHKWIESIKRRHSDLWRRTELKEWNDRTLGPLWEKFYEAWNGAGFEIIEYKEVLRDPFAFLTSLEEQGMKSRGDFHDIEKVPLERGEWTEGRRKRYLA